MRIDGAYREGPREKCHNLCKRRKQSNEPNTTKTEPNNTLTHVPNRALALSLYLILFAILSQNHF